MSASLFIGLGGNGLKILSSLKVQMEKEGITNPNDVAYLGIDIGGQDIPSNLNQTEIININEGDVTDILNDDFYWQYLEPWWFDRNYAPHFRYQQGAWQLRLLGRLALFYKGSDIINRISQIFTVLQGNGVEIFVISSTSGGTGAGLFRDIPALLKQTPNLPRNNNIFGFLLNYDIVNEFNSKSADSAIRSKKNAASLLSELDIVTLKKPQLTFHVYNSNNVGQPYTLNLSDTYRWIFLQTLNNQQGSRFDKVEDYYDLAALLLKNAYFISNNVIGKSWSGIENSIGNMLNILTNPITANFTTKSKKIISYNLPLQIVRHYVGFGGFVIEFPEDEIRDYLKIKILNEVYNELQKSTIPEDEKSKFLNTIISDIQESQNQDKLLTNIDNEISKSAQELKKNLLVSQKSELVENIFNDLSTSQDISSSIKSLKDGLNSVLSNASFSIPNIFKLLYSNTVEKINNNLINNNQYNLKQKIMLIDELISAMKYELEDYSRTEVIWSQKINESVASNELDTEINKYNNYINNIGAFQKLFKKGDIEANKNTHLNNIVNIFVNTYFRTLKLQVSNNYILSLYSNLINYLQIERQKIESDLSSFADFIKFSSNYFPNDLQNIISSPNESDFHIKLAKVKSIVDKYIYEPNTNELFAGIRNGGIINFSDFTNLKSTVENNARKVLQNYTIDKGLELEAEYFIKDLPIIINSTNNVRISQFKNLIDFAQKSSQAEKTIFLGRYKDYFDENSLNNVLNFLKKGSEDIDNNLINMCVNELITGRLTLIYNRWDSSFVKLITIAGVSDPSKYIAYKINDNNNPKTSSFFKTKVAGNHTHILSNSNTRLDFVDFSVGFSLSQLEQFFYGLRGEEKNRCETNFSYFKKPEFSNPDSSNIYHNDKRFLENIELMNYSPLIVPIESDKVNNCWKLIILLLALDYIDTDKFKKILFDSDNLKVFDKNLGFKNYNELFAVIYLFSEKDTNDLLNKLESEIKSNSDITNLLKSAENYFIENNLCDPLIPFVKEYVATLTK